MTEKELIKKMKTAIKVFNETMDAIEAAQKNVENKQFEKPVKENPYYTPKTNVFGKAGRVTVFGAHKAASDKSDSEKTFIDDDTPAHEGGFGNKKCPVSARKILKSGKLSKKELVFASQIAAARYLFPNEDPYKIAREICSAVNGCNYKGSNIKRFTAYGYYFKRI